MLLIILFVVLPLISILIAVFSDKIRDKFIFDKELNENIIDVEVDVIRLKNNDKNDYTKGLIYLTNRRIIFFKYKYGFLDMIPFIGESLVAVFIDKNNYWKLLLSELITYKFKGEIVENQNKTILERHGYTTFITQKNEFIEFDIPLDWQTNQKSKWLTKLDNSLVQKDNPNFFVP